MTFNILMAEDNPDDVELTREALNDSKIAINLIHVPDGVEAINYLRGLPPYENTVRPDLLLLDLNMPRKDGREVLEEIRLDQDLHNLPIVILTTSSAEEDIAAAYGLNANCYIQKPVDFDQFVRVVKAIEQFWFTIVKLPPKTY